MMKFKIISVLLVIFLLSSCGKGGDARKIEPNVKERQNKILKKEEVSD